MESFYLVDSSRFNDLRMSSFLGTFVVVPRCSSWIAFKPKLDSLVQSLSMASLEENTENSGMITIYLLHLMLCLNAVAVWSAATLITQTVLIQLLTTLPNVLSPITICAKQQPRQNGVFNPRCRKGNVIEPLEETIIIQKSNILSLVGRVSLAESGG